MLIVSTLLICISILVIIITGKYAFHYIKENVPLSRKRRHTSSIPVTTRDSELIENQIDVKPIEECDLDSNTCTGLYNCVHHSYPLYIYDDRLIQIQAFTKNKPGKGYCVPMKKRKCNPYTGDTAIVKREGYYDTICLCKYPHLVTKNRMFDDCNINVACGVGQLNTGISGQVTFNPVIQGECLCPEGYIAHQNPTTGPSCQKMTYEDSVKRFCSGGTVTPLGECICPKGYLQVSPTGPLYIHLSFRQQLTTTICVKNPCMFSANNPSQFLEFSKLNNYTHECQCDRVNASFPVSSTQSIINSKYNACQAIGLSKDYFTVRYGCYFYGKDDGPEGRSCWFEYEFDTPQTIFGKTDTNVTVYDNTFWIDKLVPDSYFEPRILRYLQKNNETNWTWMLGVTGGVLGSIIDSKDYSLLKNSDIWSCQKQYQERSHWGGVTRLCRLNNKIYLSPTYAQDTGVNGFYLNNTANNIVNYLKGDSPEIIIPIRFHNRPVPTVFPNEMIN